MSDPHWPDWSDPTRAAPKAYPPNPDPAYAKPDPAYAVPPYTGSWGPANPGPGYHPGYGAPMNQPTEQFPTYWQAGTGYPPPPPPPPLKPGVPGPYPPTVPEAAVLAAWEPAA